MPHQLQLAPAQLLFLLRPVQAVQIRMVQAVTLQLHQAGILHFPQLLPAQHPLGPAHGSRHNQERGLHPVFLQQRKELGVVVGPAVVKAQKHRLWDLIGVLEIGKPDRGPALLQQPAKLLLQFLCPHEQLGRGPGVVAHPVVHQDRHLVALGQRPVARAGRAVEMLILLVEEDRDLQRVAEGLHRHPGLALVGGGRGVQTQPLVPVCEIAPAECEAHVLPSPHEGDSVPLRCNFKAQSLGGLGKAHVLGAVPDDGAGGERLSVHFRPRSRLCPRATGVRAWARASAPVWVPGQAPASAPGWARA